MDSCTLEAADYSENCTTLKYKIRIARKNHVCSECGQVILKGKKYEYYVGVFDRDFYVNKTCLDCVSLCDAFFPDGGYIFNYVRDYIAEQIYALRGEISSECILPLTPEAKDFVFNKIEKTWKKEEQKNA